MFIRRIRIGLMYSMFLFLSAPVFAATTIHVPADQRTIQAGINAASDGDTVLVAPGTYFENINFSGKAITVESASGPAATIIDGGQAGPVVLFNSGETLASVLKGFTIQNGLNAGVQIDFASPTVTGNVITLNLNCQGTASIAVYSGAPLIQGNLITGNCGGMDGTILANQDTGIQIVGNVISSNGSQGIALYSAPGNPAIIQNTITQNSGIGVSQFQGGGGTLSIIQNLIANNQSVGVVWNNPPITAVSNTIVNNALGNFGGISGSEVTENYLDNTVIFENNLVIAAGPSPAFSCGSVNGSPSFANNDVFAANNSTYAGVCPNFTGTDGNISVDPLFVDLLSDNVFLQSGSPAINAGINSAPDEPKTDFDGNARVVGGTIDMGANEFVKKTALLLSSYNLHFPAQEVGTGSTPQAVTLTNQKASAVTLDLIATGANFSQTNNCGKTLASGATCQINITFAPVIGGSINSTVGLFTSATTNPLTVNLLGTGLAAQLQFYGNFFFFDVVGTSNTQIGTLSNTGQAPLTINSIIYKGPTDFVVSNDCPSSLGIGAFCTVSVTFTPTFIGSESGILTLNDNSLPSPQTFTLSGSSVSAGVPTLMPASLTFPPTLIGQSSAPQTVTLTNTGAGTLGITGISSYGDFSETNNCPAFLAVGASCTFTVVYNANAHGSESENLFITTDGLNSEVYVFLMGTGQAPAPAITSLSLTNAPVDSSDTQITITGSGFVNDSTLDWNGVPLSCCANAVSSTQLVFTIPAANLTTLGTFQVSVFTSTPGGGTSNSLPFTVYTPINYAVKSVNFEYRTITGTNLDLSFYQSQQITSPFPIQFGGGSFTNLTAGAGGTISFNEFAPEFNDVIPTTQTPMLIAPFWAALDPFGTANNNNVFWAVIGSAPNRQLVVEWRNVPYCCSQDGQDTVKFQTVFFEGGSNILFNYADTVFGGQSAANDNGATATSGVQVAPNVGTQFSFDQPLLLSKTSLLWYPGSPTATLSTSNLGFGYHQIGTESLAQTVTLNNGSLASLLISSITIDNPDFTQTNNCGASLATHKTCTVHVFFKPSAPLAETATLTIADNSTNSPQTVALTGIGAITPIVVFPITANFGNVKVGTSSTVPVVLANAANGTLNIQQITATPAIFTETNNCGSSLPAGASCTVNVTFTPAQKGSVSGKLSMGLDGKAPVAEVKLLGSGQ